MHNDALVLVFTENLKKKWHIAGIEYAKYAIKIILTLMTLALRLPTRSSHNAVNSRQVSLLDAATKEIFCLNSGQLLSSSHRHKLIHARTIALAHALNTRLELARQA
jgi:hypothetical protein